ncbi:MAG: hypothetical protein MR519_10555 [Spirochaetaceae bacterium]|nr:hypothetical protein [Spirochaetaceae bacterium]
MWFAPENEKDPFKPWEYETDGESKKLPEINVEAIRELKRLPSKPVKHETRQNPNPIKKPDKDMILGNIARLIPGTASNDSYHQLMRELNVARSKLDDGNSVIDDVCKTIKNYLSGHSEDVMETIIAKEGTAREWVYASIYNLCVYRIQNGNHFVFIGLLDFAGQDYWKLLCQCSEKLAEIRPEVYTKEKLAKDEASLRSWIKENG